jgi:hypothetical protein
MIERALELVAATADEILAARDFDLIALAHGIAGLAGNLAVDAHLPGHHGALGLFAALTQAALDEGLVQPGAHRARTSQTVSGVESGELPSALRLLLLETRLPICPARIPLRPGELLLRRRKRRLGSLQLRREVLRLAPLVIRLEERELVVRKFRSHRDGVLQMPGASR